MQLRMITFSCLEKTMKHFSHPSGTKLSRLINSFRHPLQLLLLRINPFFIEYSYFIFLSVMGYGVLKASKTRTPSFSPRNIDIFFTSVSAATVSSISTVEMEVFSNTQLIFGILLMFVGGEVFTSMLELRLMKFKIKTNNQGRQNKCNSDQEKPDFSNPDKFLHQIELCVVSDPQEIYDQQQTNNQARLFNDLDSQDLSLSSILLLSYIVLWYLLVVHILGSSLIYIYTSFIPSAREVLEKKALKRLTFSIFTTVSTFSNCGFLPTNENMMVFKRNSGLLLIVIPQVLMGNTLYSSCLRLIIWFSEKITKRAEFTFMLKNSSQLGYIHLFSGLHTKLLASTVFGFICLQFISFCALEWHSEAMSGLNNYQKLVGSLFQVVNSRHAGESVFDLSVLNPAILVLFVIMMYLPPYTSFFPIEDDGSLLKKEKNTRKKGRSLMENLVFSQLTYLVIFIITICITEKEKMKEDPLNFNLLSIVVEVMSAYGNVGFSVGYSCGRQIKPHENCKDASYGFAGNWSDEGKFVLIAVMFFGRLKKFSANGGKSWRFF